MGLNIICLDDFYTKLSGLWQIVPISFHFLLSNVPDFRGARAPAVVDPAGSVCVWAALKEEDNTTLYKISALSEAGPFSIKVAF